MVSCEQPNGYTDDDLDCDDGDDLAGPEVEWWFDGVGAGVTVGPHCDSPAIDAVPALGQEDRDDAVSTIDPGAEDECGDESGAYTMSGVFEGLANGVEIGSTCTGMTTSDREALFPVNLLPGERIRAVITGEILGYGYDYTYGENDSLYLMEPCGGGAAACVAGGVGRRPHHVVVHPHHR